MNPAQSNRSSYPKRELKHRTCLKALSILELVLAILVIIFGTISTIVVNTNDLDVYFLCGMGHGIWVGIFGVIAAGLGLGAFRTVYCNKCLMVSHFVMCIISTVADGIMVIFASFCLSEVATMPYSDYYYNYYYSTPHLVDPVLRTGLMANESLLLIASLVHFTTSIVSTAYVCRNWCGGHEPDEAVIHLPSSQFHAPPQSTSNYAVGVPPGVQVIYVPYGAGQEATAPPLTNACSRP